MILQVATIAWFEADSICGSHYVTIPLVGANPGVNLFLPLTLFFYLNYFVNMIWALNRGPIN
jgi:hypothetical protein